MCTPLPVAPPHNAWIVHGGGMPPGGMFQHHAGDCLGGMFRTCRWGYVAPGLLPPRRWGGASTRQRTRPHRDRAAPDRTLLAGTPRQMRRWWTRSHAAPYPARPAASVNSNATRARRPQSRHLQQRRSRRYEMRPRPSPRRAPQTAPRALAPASARTEPATVPACA